MPQARFFIGRGLLLLAGCVLLIHGGARADGTFCGQVVQPDPIAYPDATPPEAAEAVVPIIPSGGATIEVATAGELLAAVGQAAAGDTIVLTASITQSLNLSKDGLRFVGSVGGRKLWRGTPRPTGEGTYSNGIPALTVAAGVGVTLENLEIVGGSGSGGNGTFDLSGTPGGSGGPGANIAAGASVNLINSLLAGSPGSRGSNTDGYVCQLLGTPVYTGSGGNGGPAWIGTGSLYADLGSGLRGGAGGVGYDSYDSDCCILTGSNGGSALPGEPTQWVAFALAFENAQERSIGDFDGSGCSDVGDFLLLLDAWQANVGGAVVNLADFLALIDNWQTGAGCV